jgi:hypothetical protein
MPRISGINFQKKNKYGFLDLSFGIGPVLRNFK